MRKRHRLGGRFGRAAACSALAGTLAACTTGGQGDAGPLVAEVQPRKATYQCEDAEPVTIENRRSSLILTTAGGASIELAMAPESQGSRYVQDGMAVVLDGRDALIMPAGAEPIPCKR
ncbi:MAG: hypothetical protein KF723_18570 [Rhizobiaceae bacterium]|nr:hypothetical protein [Rhizobiaceae bacterium]